MTSSPTFWIMLTPQKPRDLTLKTSSSAQPQMQLGSKSLAKRWKRHWTMNWRQCPSHLLTTRAWTTPVTGDPNPRSTHGTLKHHSTIILIIIVGRHRSYKWHSTCRMQLYPQTTLLARSALASKHCNTATHELRTRVPPSVDPNPPR